MDENVIQMEEYQDEPKFGEIILTEEMKERIRKMDEEIEALRETILNAQGALDSAEKELDDILSELKF